MGVGIIVLPVSINCEPAPLVNADYNAQTYILAVEITISICEHILYKLSESTRFEFKINKNYFYKYVLVTKTMLVKLFLNNDTQHFNQLL